MKNYTTLLQLYIESINGLTQQKVGLLVYIITCILLIYTHIVLVPKDGKIVCSANEKVVS